MVVELASWIVHVYYVLLVLKGATLWCRLYCTSSISYLCHSDLVGRVYYPKFTTNRVLSYRRHDVWLTSVRPIVSSMIAWQCLLLLCTWFANRLMLFSSCWRLDGVAVLRRYARCRHVITACVNRRWQPMKSENNVIKTTAADHYTKLWCHLLTSNVCLTYFRPVCHGKSVKAPQVTVTGSIE